MTQLYIIAQEYKDAADKLADLDLDAQTIADTLEGLAGDLDGHSQHGQPGSSDKRSRSRDEQAPKVSRVSRPKPY